MIEFLKSIKKTVYAVIAGLGTWLTVAIISDSGPITKEEWVLLIGEVLTAFGVWKAENIPSTP